MILTLENHDSSYSMYNDFCITLYTYLIMLHSATAKFQGHALSHKDTLELKKYPNYQGVVFIVLYYKT